MEGTGEGAPLHTHSAMRSDDSQRTAPPPLGGPHGAAPRPVYTPYTFSLPSSFPPNNPPFHAYPSTGPMQADAAHFDTGFDDGTFPSPTSSRRTSAHDVQIASSIPSTFRRDSLIAEDSDMIAHDGALVGTSAQPSKIIQKADRSCKKCRERRVRCGREFPTCSRCKKRRDACSYGDGVYVEETVEGSDQQRIADLESKISSLQSQLRNATAAAPSRTATASGSTSSSPVLRRDSLPADVSRALTDILAPADASILSTFIAGKGRGRTTPSLAGVDYRLASSSLASDLTCHLLDAAVRACDSKLPGLIAISSRIPFFKQNLNDLEPHDQVNVATLCALGARTSPHSPFFGVSSVTSAEGAPIPALFVTVGSRREALCATLEKRARETAWATGLFRTPTHEAAEAIAALTMLGLHEENDAEETRWFVRQAAGLFLDLRHAEMLSGASTSRVKNVGLAVFLADAQLAVRCSRPTIISPSELQEYWATAGLVIPDLVNARMPEMVDDKLRSAMSYDDLNELIETILFYVYACYRVFAQVTGPARRSDTSSVLGFIRSLWNLVDQIHNSIQRLQQHLVSLADPFPGSDGDPHAVDHAILLAVLADNVLVHLVGYIHVYLLRDRSTGLYGPEREGDEDLERARGESSMRVFKCLKLFAFYCQLYCGSQDKHNVFHLLMQLAPLQNWTHLVALRIGQPGGPLSDEFEVSEEEVEWFRMALELSLFYSPRLGPSLQALLGARQKYMQKPPPETFELIASPMYSPTVANHPPYPQHVPQHPSVSSPAASTSSVHYAYSQPDTQLSPIAPSFDMAAAAASAARFSLSAPVPGFTSTSPTHAPPIPFPFDHAHPDSHSHSHQHAHQQQAPTPREHQAQHASTPQQVRETAAVALHTQEGFADGAVEDLAGLVTDVRSAFRSVDWADLSLTPAPVVGSDGSSSSMEDWLRGAVSGPQ